MTVSLHTQSQRHFSLGLTTVNLNLGKSAYSAFATCGDGFFSINMKDAKLDAITISDIYLTDGPRHFQQDSVAAMTMVPYIETSTLSEAVLAISGDCCFVTAVSEKQGIVPNNIKVHGSPHTLIELRSLNCFVSASSYVFKRSLTTRAVRDVVQFSSGEWNCFWETDIGWKVHSMTEWSFRRTPDATQRHVLVAVAVGRATRPAEATPAKFMNGKLYLLRPPTVGGTAGSKVLHFREFEAPVTAMATYGDMGLVLCSGKKVHFLELDIETLKSVSCMIFFRLYEYLLTVSPDSTKYATLSCIVLVCA